MIPDSPKLCECGCGQPAPIAKANHKRSGHVKGRPVRFISGHNVAPPTDILTRFFSHVAMPDNLDDCWEWTSRLTSSGYGQFAFSHDRPVPAHRWLFEFHNGPLAKGMLACHTCDNRKCVNPAHIFPGTALDNRHDAVNKGRVPKGEAYWAQRNREEHINRLTARADTIQEATRGANHYSRTRLSNAIKLQPDDVRQIRQLLASGIKQTAIAKQYGVNSSTISNIATRKRWADVI